MYTNEHIKSLLPGYFKGKLSEEDALEVKEWIALSEENYQEALWIHKLVLVIDSEKVAKRKAKKTALHHIKRKIKFKQVFLFMQRAAAILFIPLLLTWYLSTGYSSKNEQLTSDWKEISTLPGTIYKFYLSDSTYVCLNAGSTLRYPSTFSGSTRDVILTGEGYFEVKKNVQKQFIVRTPFDAEIKVYGTKFNVEAYTKEALIHTTLLEGSVGFEFENNNKKEKIMLKPGYKLTYNRTQQSCLLSATDGRVETSWVDNQLILYHTPFREAVRMLEKRYNTQFIIKTSKYDKNKYSGTFTNQEIDKVMEYFELSSNLHWDFLHQKGEKVKIVIY